MRLLVTGGRSFSDRNSLFGTLGALHAEHHFTPLIHGDARGADRLVGEWVQERGIQVLACPVDWKRYGRGAGPIRNRRMLDEKPDLAVAFTGGREDGEDAVHDAFARLCRGRPCSGGGSERSCRAGRTAPVEQGLPILLHDRLGETLRAERVAVTCTAGIRA